MIQHTDAVDSALDRGRVGGKAVGLVRLMRAGASVPPWFVLPPDGEIIEAVNAWREAGWSRVAVRSSAIGEDGAAHSFAGMYQSVLGVTDADGLAAAIETCRASADNERVAAYLAEHQLESTPVAVIVQELVEGDASGVMFTADPSDPDRTLISVAWGLGEGVVQGSVPCDTVWVDRSGQVEQQLADKDHAISLVDGAVAEVPVPESMRKTPALSDGQATELAATGRAIEAALGGPQDVEWTRVGDKLVLLQARPITQPMPQGRRLLWDNANIIESYYGPTLPLTYSFASRAYTIVYQLFCEVMGVSPAVLRENAGVFPRMIGLVRGRIFYNLDAWYTVVSLLPGYRWNRTFMEQMMGVSDVADTADPAAEGSRWSALPSLLRSVGGLVWRAGRLDKDVVRFTAQFEEAMSAHPRDLGQTDPLALVEMYGDLERRLLWAWSTPIVNDFFVMIFHGLLRSLCGSWIADGEDLHNGLLSGEGGLLSAEPALEAMRIADQIAGKTEWRVLFDSALDDGAVYRESAAVPALRQALDDYLDTYGDRCPDELKLEATSLRQRPGLLIATLRAYLASPNRGDLGAVDKGLRIASEQRVSTQLSPIRALAFNWVLVRARRRVRDRENLRFLRTRVFGRVRDIFVRLGQHMVEAGALDTTRDVFWLTVDEVFGWVRGTTVTTNTKGLVALRREEYAGWEAAPEPADRFHTWGPVWAHNLFLGRPKAPTGEGLHGLAACPGVVEGTVRRVTDPNNAGDVDGAVMIAYRTDPGWVPLFPRIAALVVERGSLLSHSAVVAREMGIPSVVAVAGVMDALQDGDRVRVDAGAGTIEILDKRS